MYGSAETAMSQIIEIPTPMKTPCRMPNVITPSRAASAAPNSYRLTVTSRFISPTSIIPSVTASMMIAPRTASGSFEKIGARKSSVKMTKPPWARLDTCDRAPAPSLTGLFDRLPLLKIPWNTLDDTFDMPWASNSWSTSIR